MPKTHATLLAGDFNAEYGTDPSIFPDVISDFGYGKINDNSLRMLSFASANNFVLSGSWFRKKPRLRYTFFSNDGKTKKQLDHILVSRRFCSMVDKPDLSKLQTENGLHDFHIALHNRFAPSADLLESDDLENSWSNFKTAVSESLIESCPTVRNRTLSVTLTLFWGTSLNHLLWILLNPQSRKSKRSSLALKLGNHLVLATFLLRHSKPLIKTDLIICTT